MTLKLVNQKTGKVVLEENDDGEMVIHDEKYKEAVESQKLQEKITD